MVLYKMGLEHDSLEPVKSWIAAFAHTGRSILRWKFSREFQRKDRGKWEFALTKVQNSLENFSENLMVSDSVKASSRDFTYCKIPSIRNLSATSS